MLSQVSDTAHGHHVSFLYPHLLDVKEDTVGQYERIFAYFLTMWRLMSGSKAVAGHQAPSERGFGEFKSSNQRGGALAYLREKHSQAPERRTGI